MSLVAVLVGSLLAGCNERKAPAPTAAPSTSGGSLPVPSAGRPTPATSGGAPSASASAAATASTAAPAASALALPIDPNAPKPACEVEMFGKVKGGKPSSASTPEPIVFASYDDCATPTAANIGQTTVNPDGTFFLEVFVKWGSDLTLCAAQPPGPGKPSTTLGKYAKPIHAEALGEIEVREIEIELRPVAPRKIALPRPSGGF